MTLPELLKVLQSDSAIQKLVYDYRHLDQYNSFRHSIRLTISKITKEEIWKGPNRKLTSWITIQLLPTRYNPDWVLKDMEDLPGYFLTQQINKCQLTPALTCTGVAAGTTCIEVATNTVYTSSTNFNTVITQPQPTKEINMSTPNAPIFETRHFIHGQEAADMTDDTIINTIATIETKNKSLIAIENKGTTILEAIKANIAAIKQLNIYLDERSAK